MLIFGPIRQVGWRSAVSGVAAAISAREALRNGPPEAVSQSRRSGSRRLARHWWMAACSLSTGISGAPEAAAAPAIRAPAATSASLLASPTTSPFRSAARVGRSPAAPTMAATTTSTPGQVAARSSPSGPAAISTSGNREPQAARNFSASAGSPIAATSGR